MNRLQVLEALTGARRRHKAQGLSQLSDDGVSRILKITVLCQYFQGPGEAGIPLLYEFVEALDRNGHQVAVVAGRRGYMDRAIIGRDGPPWRLISRVRMGGVRVLRPAALETRNRGFLARLLEYLSFSVTSLGGLILSGRADVIFGSSPPLFLMPTGWVWARLTGAKFVLEVRDLWPESAEALGVVRSRPLLWLTGKLALFLYRHSDGIVALTKGIAAEVGEKIAKPPPILVSRYALRPAAESTVARTRADVRREQGWEDICVAIYTGTLGHANNVATLVEAAHALRNRSAFRLVIIGDGVNRRQLESKAEELALQNVEFLAPVAQQNVVQYMAGADIGLVSLKKHPLFDGAVPTKMLEYMSVGLPVVAPNLKEIAEIVDGNGCGLLYDPLSVDDLTHALATLLETPKRRAELGLAGRTAIERNFSPGDRNRRLETFMSNLTS